MRKVRPELRPLQFEAVHKQYALIRKNPAHGVYNASEPGTGKGPMTIELLNLLSASQFQGGPCPLLTTVIVCPKSMKLKWRDELNKWCKFPETPECLVLQSEKDIKSLNSKNPKSLNSKNLKSLNNYDFIIVNYELARNKKILNWLSSKELFSLVIDECHRVKATRKKTKKGNITQKGAILDSIWPNAFYKICLSGTPFTNGIDDCWTIFSRLAPNHFTDWYSFVKTYCYEDVTPWGPKYYGLKNSEKLKEITRSEFLVRYTLEEMAPELPEIQWNKIALSYEEWAVVPTEEEKKENQKYIELLEEAIGMGKAIPSPPKHLSTKRIEQSLKKLPAVLEIVKESVDSHRATLVFFCYLDPLKKFIEEMKDYNPSIIYGANSEKERYEAIHKFQSGETDLCVLQISAGGVGVDLFRAQVVVFAEMDYSPANIAQAIGRSRRIGNKSQYIEIIYPVVESTIEEDAVRAVMSKSKIFQKILC